MRTGTIQVDYEQLEEIRRRFTVQAEAVLQMQQQIRQGMDELSGGWSGEAAQAFTQQISDQVLPGIQGLANAFQRSQEVAARLILLFKEAEGDTGLASRVTSPGLAFFGQGVPGGFASPPVGKAIDYNALSQTAAGRASAMKTAQEASIRKTGIGRYYGNKSDFAGMTAEERKEWIDHHKKPGVTTSKLKGYGCIGWVLDVTKAGYEKAGAIDEFNKIQEVVRKRGYQANVLVHELQKRGWKVVYFNRDVGHTAQATKDGKTVYDSAWEYRRVKKDLPVYPQKITGLVADDEMINFDPVSGSSTAGDPSGLRKLEQVPYFVGFVGGGYHAFVGSSGKITEFHIGNEPDSSTIIEETPIEDYFHKDRERWHSGFVAIPPGSWK
jgi:WXG100 family type VII secretion target